MILRNMSKHVDEMTKTKFLSEFSLRMKDSEYSAEFRREVIECGVKGYEKQVKRDEDGICPMYRQKGYKADEREKEKRLKKMSWYKPFNPVLFCPPTPNSKLANELKSIAKETSEKILMKIKVVERAGVSIRSKLPGLVEDMESQHDESKCFVHSNGGKGNCRIEGVVYRG